jgi:hypothetical protein
MAFMRHLWIGSALFLFSISQASAQDVCCVLGRATEGGTETQATVRSASECAPGSKSGDYKVCSSFRDDQNTCPQLGVKEQCEKCGFHWNGTSCLAEDPVKKAKKELEEQAKKEKAKQESAKPSPTATPTATPAKK